MNLPMTKVGMIESKQSFPRTTFKVIMQLQFAFLPFYRERTSVVIVFTTLSLYDSIKLGIKTELNTQLSLSFKF
jgi:hypothetical protein